MDVKEINSAIMFGKLTNDELSTVIDAVKFARAQLTQQKKRELAPGSAVKFYSTKKGKTITGTVIKVAIKYVTVSEHGTTFAQWKVPANMLEVA